jgi:hypothetical protein
MIKVGDTVKPSKSSDKTMEVTMIERVDYMGRKATFVEGLDHNNKLIRCHLRSVIKVDS